MKEKIALFIVLIMIITTIGPIIVGGNKLANFIDELDQSQDEDIY